MNERITELMKQAGVNPTKTMIDGNGYEFKFPDPNLQKFAELIVKECAGIYSKIDNGNLHMGTNNYLEALHKTFRS